MSARLVIGAGAVGGLLTERLVARGDRVQLYPKLAMTALARIAPDIREVMRMEYQFARPFVVDSTDSERLLGVRATPWDEALAATVASYR